MERDEEGERSFRYWRSESAARRLFSDGTPPLEALKGFDLIYLSGITLAILPPERRAALIATCAALRQSGCVIAFDSNCRPRHWENSTVIRKATNAMWRVTDVEFPSLEDLQALHRATTAERFMTRLADMAVSEIVLRDGNNGTTTRRAGKPDRHHRPTPVEVVDSTAAGDAYNAAYLASWLKSGTESEAMRAAQLLAEPELSHPGAILPPRTVRR